MVVDHKWVIVILFTIWVLHNKDNVIVSGVIQQQCMFSSVWITWVNWMGLGVGGTGLGWIL